MGTPNSSEFNRWRAGHSGPRGGRLRGALGVGAMLLMGVAYSAPPAKSDANPLGLLNSNWELVAPFGGRGATPRAADRSSRGEVAVADESGVTWWRGTRRERAQIEDVRDVAFDSAGRLWIGAGTGLYTWTLPGRPLRRALRGGEAANRIRRLAVQGESLLVASEQGAFWSTSGRIFQSLGGVAANDEYSLGVFKVGGGEGGGGIASVPPIEAWLLGRLGLVRIHGMQTPTGLRVVRMDREALPRPPGDGSATDLAISRDGRTLWIAYADALASRAIMGDQPGDQSGAGASGHSSERWVWLRPVLPPGAAIQRFVPGPGDLLLASDSGLLSAGSEAEPFWRAASAAGTSNCVDVRAARSAAIALCREGVFERKGEESPATTRSPRSALETAKAAPFFVPSLPEDPPLSEIRRRALKRSGLTVSRAEAMRRGLARRALLPDLSLRFSADVDRDRSRDQDQAFISGDTRYLLDRSRDQGLGLDAAIEFEWDLGGLAYPEDSVDLSRELRQVISLRDDIADEINQLYFERQRIRERLTTEPGTRPSLMTQEEARALYWRAREIDAGLDAWTGGWIADWRRGRRSRAATNPKDHPVQEKGKTR